MREGEGLSQGNGVIGGGGLLMDREERGKGLISIRQD